MIYFFRVEYKSYYSIEVSDLLCPLSGAVEPMRLVLYQKEAETTMSKQYVKRPSGVFFRISDNKDFHRFCNIPCIGVLWLVRARTFYRKPSERKCKSRTIKTS